jgi:hypothetical protein
MVVEMMAGDKALHKENARVGLPLEPFTYVRSSSG